MFSRNGPPKVVAMATSDASRPLPITMRPLRRMLLRGSKVHHWSPSQTSIQAAKSIGAGSGGTSMSGTLQELHHHEQAHLVVGTEIVDADDVFVGYLGGGLRFRQEAVAGFGILRCRLDQDFNRHRASDNRIEGLVDMRHPTTEEFLQLVLAEAGGQLHQSERNL